MPGSVRWWFPTIVLGVCLVYFVDPNPRLDFSAFDQNDAESYLALSQSLIAGRGYTRSLDPQYYVPHTTWPPGLPFLLTPLTFLSGVPINLEFIKSGMIAYGVVGIVLAYLYAKRITRSPVTQLCVALFLALNPYYWQFSRMTDSEMPTIVWSLVALLLADIGWSTGMIRYRAAFASGLVCGFGMLIRGSFFGALLLPLAILLVRRPEPIVLRQLASRYACYIFGFVLPFLVWMLRNRSIDAAGLGFDGINQLAMIAREDPLDPVSPFRNVSQFLTAMLATFKWQVIYAIPRSIVPGLWSQAVWDNFGRFSAPVALFVSTPIVVLSCLSVRNLPVIVMYASMAALNLAYSFGAMGRLWVPVSCLMAISLPISAESLPILCNRAVRSLAIAATVGAMAVSLIAYARNHDRYPYHDPDYAALAAMFEEIRNHGPVNGNVLTPNADAFGLYTGTNAPISVPGIGVNPAYDYVIIPTSEWIPSVLSGTSINENAVWSLIRLSIPMTLFEIKERYTNWQKSTNTTTDRRWPWFICPAGHPAGCKL